MLASVAVPSSTVSPFKPLACSSRRVPAVSTNATRADSNAVTSSTTTTEAPYNRRGLLTAALVAVSLASAPSNAVAEELATPSSTGTIYFGNGCFWGRQHDFVETEKMLGRAPEEISAVVGYGAGMGTGPDGKVCYYYSDPRTIYEKLGHAEVVQVDISQEPAKAEQEFRMFAKTYFKQFNRTPFGMARQDPQDQGAGYRNVVGLPGGMDSPLFKILQEENVNKMKLLKGQGNRYINGRASEEDKLNTIWVVDSNERSFYLAEQWHQFHDGLGYGFPDTYKKVLKGQVAQAGRIKPTGCPEYPFF